MKKVTLMILILILAAGLTGCSSSSSSSSPTISIKNLIMVYGKVVNENTTEPVEEATVTMGTENRVTNTDGIFTFNLAAGTYTLQVDASGYLHYERQEGIIDNGEDVILPDVSLTPLSGTASLSGGITIHNFSQSDSYSTRATGTGVNGSSSVNNISSINSFAPDNLQKTADRSVTSPAYKPGEVIVKYRSGISRISTQQVEPGLIIQDKLESRNGEIVKYKISSGKSVTEMIDSLRQRGDVEWVEPNYILKVSKIPTDPYYSIHPQPSTQWGPVYCNLEAAWDLATGSDSIKVAVLDTGIIPDHPDLEDNLDLAEGADFVGGADNQPVEDYQLTDDDPTDESPLHSIYVDGSHGTHVSGIIGAVSNNNEGIAGINWNISLLPIRVLGADGNGTSWDIAEGIYYAIDRGANIINLSLGRTSINSGESQLERDALQAADSAGLLIFAAAGNNGSAVDFPARYPEAIAVGAINYDRELASYSNTGPEIELVAPGGGSSGSIYSTWGYYENGQTVSSYTFMEGTSMATPHVSGIAALMLAYGIPTSQVRARLQNTAVDLGSEGKDDSYGFGLVDAYAALLDEKLSNPEVFLAEMVSGEYYYKSGEVTAGSDGSFSLSNLLAGEYSLVGWRDVNNNSIIDEGDYFGEKKITIEDGTSYPNQNLDVYYLPLNSGFNPISVH